MALIDNRPQHAHVIISKRILPFLGVLFHYRNTQMDWWIGKTKVFREKTALVPIILLQIPY
jgi:hypothetical protein